MIKKVNFLEIEYVYNENQHKSIPYKIIQKTPTYFNISLIKYIDILKLQKKTVWCIHLSISDETIYTEPFKI